MKVKVSANERIKDLRTERKLNQEQLGTQIGIPNSTIADYEKDDYMIPHTAIIKLADFFGVSADFLMGRTENRSMENMEISELHLTDDALHLLREQKINTRLLSEIMTHENFRKLMVDAEIYVDGLADMQIQNLNFAVDTVRELILKKYAPDEHELYINTLKAQHIDLDDYFARTVNEDAATILRDIRNAHKKDPESAPPAKLKQWCEDIIDKASSYNGTKPQKVSYLFSLLFKIKPTDKNLSAAEQFLRKSEILEPNARKRRRKK